MFGWVTDFMRIGTGRREQERRAEALKRQAFEYFAKHEADQRAQNAVEGRK